MIETSVHQPAEFVDTSSNILNGSGSIFISRCNHLKEQMAQMVVNEENYVHLRIS